MTKDGSTPAPEPHVAKATSFGRIAVVSVAVVAAFAVLMSLGFWQVRRLAWKEDLIARVEARVDASPVAMPPPEDRRQAGFVAAFEYRPVTVDGRFAALGDADGFRRFYAFTVLSEPRGRLGGQGYWVMHLFRPDDGAPFYVNRGFVPGDDRGREAPPPDGPVTVTGLVRSAATGNAFTPGCDVGETVCYVRDVDRAAALAGETAVAPFFLDLSAGATPPGGLPQAGETRVRFPNNHLQYAITWFGLAAALVGVVGAYALTSWRRGRL